MMNESQALTAAQALVARLRNQTAEAHGAHVQAQATETTALRTLQKLELSIDAAEDRETLRRLLDSQREATIDHKLAAKATTVAAARQTGLDAELARATAALERAADAYLRAGQPARIKRFERLVAEMLGAAGEISGDVGSVLDRPIRGVTLLSPQALRIIDSLDALPDGRDTSVLELRGGGASWRTTSAYARRRQALLDGVAADSDGEAA